VITTTVGYYYTTVQHVFHVLGSLPSGLLGEQQGPGFTQVGQGHLFRLLVQGSGLTGQCCMCWAACKPEVAASAAKGAAGRAAGARLHTGGAGLKCNTTM
jgi:hypothetical protein